MRSNYSMPHLSTKIFEITNCTLTYFINVKGQVTKTYSIYNIGITPDQTTVYAEFYHGLRL